MIRLLVVAYYFPPRGGAGTQRFAKFCKYLPEFGIEPVVLTSGDIDPNDNAPHDDPTLLGDGMPVVERVDEPRRVPLAARMRRKLRLDLDEDVWAAAAADRAVELLGRETCDAVITTLSPFACYRVGERLQRELGLPWLCDLRDPWALDAWRGYRTRFHAARDLGHMRRALMAADCVVANVPEARRAFVALGASAARTVVIPNGFDEDDFDTSGRAAWFGDGAFHLVHIGTLHAVDGPEGLTRNGMLRVRHRQIEPLGRSGYYLLHALALIKHEAPEAYRRLRVHFYGSVDPTHGALVERLGVGEAIVWHGYVPHAESIAALRSADAVFVPLHGVPSDERALVVPGKLYEALASGRPVLAALPPGDGGDLVRRLEAGVVVPPTDAKAIAGAMRSLLAVWEAGAPAGGCARESLEPFSRRRLAGMLATAVRGVVRDRPVIELPDPWRIGRAGQESA